MEAILKIVKTARFDDVDHDLGYEHRGYNYEIQSEEGVLLIRIYDDEPEHATVVRPTTMPANNRFRLLVEFLQTELKVSRISVYRSDLGELRRDRS